LSAARLLSLAHNLGSAAWGLDGASDRAVLRSLEGAIWALDLRSATYSGRLPAQVVPEP